MIDINELKTLCNKRAIRWTNHVLKRLFQRGINTDDVIYAIQNGDVIEQYPADYPYPSCLVLGNAKNEIAIHVVCGVGIDELWLITVYYPDSNEWTSDLKTRKRR